MRRAWMLSFSLLASCGSGDPETTAPADSEADAAEETAPVDTAADSEEPMFDSGSPDALAETIADSATETAVDTGKITCTGSQLEPNDSLPTARPLTGIDDCDGSGSSLSGVVGGIDVDFWTYKGSDSFGCTVDPYVTNHSASVRVCVFAQCGAGPTEFKKCNKGTAFKLPSGIAGCCTDGPGDASLDFACTLVGSDDSADVFMRVDSPGATTCLPYDVDYHF
ncbi:MAG: hypothetical protein ACXWUG_16940 [Polyangiales bacterium]